MRIYNSLTRKIEDFEPMKPPRVAMYTCGSTVYFYPTIGNWRTYVLSDLVFRALTYVGFKVDFVMNLTDVGHLTSDADTGEDKLEKRARKEGKTAWEVAKFYGDDFIESFGKLNLTKPMLFSKATDHIKEQIELVERIEKAGFAYRISDGVYFDVGVYETDGNIYGELSNLDEIKAGARVEVNPEKKDPRDFALWKFSPVGEKRDMEWDSPWGKGFPGWHIECSAMSSKYLGTHFDVHTGGVDNIFPHHENEIAQSEAASGEKFVNFWLHCEHLLVDGEKMSKSLGNFIFLRQLLEKGVDPTAIRLTLLNTHYRQKLNFTEEKLDISAKMITRLRDFRKSLGDDLTDGAALLSEIVSEARQNFESALDDDLNISEALAAVFTLMHEVNNFHRETALSQADAKQIEQFLTAIDTVLNIFSSKLENLTDEEQALMNQRTVARQNRDWKESDRLRALLLEKGIVVEDTPKGAVWKRKLST